MERLRRSSWCGQVGGLVAALGAVTVLAGCNPLSHLDMGTDLRGSQFGRVYYVGGAGPLGNVAGATDVPRGLRKAGYRGSIEVVAWQSTFGGTVRDQVDRERNEDQGRQLARQIVGYARRYPGRPVNIVALSAGTGVATWALEKLPAGVTVDNVVFLASSLSRSYDLGPALMHVTRRLYNFYSPEDPVLRYGMPITGSVDDYGSSTAAGLFGFEVPAGLSEGRRALYDMRVQNMPYRKQYREYGYRGLHTDGTSADFVQYVIAPLMTKTPGMAVTGAESGGTR